MTAYYQSEEAVRCKQYWTNRRGDPWGSSSWEADTIMMAEINTWTYMNCFRWYTEALGMSIVTNSGNWTLSSSLSSGIYTLPASREIEHWDYSSQEIVFLFPRSTAKQSVRIIGNKEKFLCTPFLSCFEMEAFNLILWL
jgi:hypothetical protein